MGLYTLLCERAEQRRPLSVGLIGAGKFGAMYLAQAPNTPGVHIAAIADLSPGAARVNLGRVGWKAEQYGAAFFGNSANPSGVISIDEDLSDEQILQMARTWNQAHQGLSSAHLPAIRTGGVPPPVLSRPHGSSGASTIVLSVGCKSARTSSRTRSSGT